MGKTQVPLIIFVDPEWLDHPQIVERRNQGHTILPLEMRGDLVLSKASWNWDDDMFDEKGRNLETSIKAVRARKRPKKEKHGR